MGVVLVKDGVESSGKPTTWNTGWFRPRYATEEERRIARCSATKNYRASHPNCAANKSGIRESHRNLETRRKSHAAAVARIRQHNRTIIARYKSRPCKDCGIQYPLSVMDFDHIKARGPKLFTVSARIGVYSGRLIAEILKSDVVCANCHRIREAKRDGRLKS